MLVGEGSSPRPDEAVADMTDLGTAALLEAAEVTDVGTATMRRKPRRLILVLSTGLLTDFGTSVD